MNVGKSLKVAIAINERDSQWVAEKLGSSVSWVNLLKNQTGAQASTLERLAAMFDMSVSEFIALGE